MCISCTVIDSVQSTGLQAAGQVYSQLTGPAKNILEGAIGVVFLWKFVRQCIDGFDWWDLIWNIFMLQIAVFLLSDQNNYYTWIYQPLSSLVFGVAGITMGNVQGAQSGNLDGVAAAVEQNFSIILNITLGIWGDAGWHLGNYIVGAFLIIPYLLQLIVFTLIISWAIGLMLVPYALGPVFIVAGMFKATKRILLAMFDMYLSAFMLVVVGGFFLGLVSSAANNVVTHLSATSGDVGTLGDPSLWSAAVVGAVGVWLMLKTETVSAYVTNRIDGVGGSAQKALGSAWRGLKGMWG